MSPPLLSLRDATVQVGAQALFAGLSLAIGKGDRICLVGRNGSGKSTLLKALAGLIELDAGERFLQPRTSVAYLPQEPALEPARARSQAVLGGLPPASEHRAGPASRADAAGPARPRSPAPRSPPCPAARRGASPWPRAGRRPRRPAARRADQPPRPADHRAPRAGSGRVSRRPRPRQPRPRLPRRAQPHDLVARSRRAARPGAGLRGVRRLVGGAARRGGGGAAPAGQADRGGDRLVAPRHHRAPQAQPGPAAAPADAARASAPGGSRRSARPSSPRRPIPRAAGW